MLTSNLGYVILFAKNPIKSAEFYSDLFQIKPVQKFPTFVLFSLSNGIMFGLWSKYTAEPRVESDPGAMEICFSVEEVDKVYDFVGQKGVTVVQEPTDMDFGRTFVFLDPDGHRIRIFKLHKK